MRAHRRGRSHRDFLYVTLDLAGYRLGSHTRRSVLEAGAPVVS
jgi:hypothetical protein